MEFNILCPCTFHLDTMQTTMQFANVEIRNKGIKKSRFCNDKNVRIFIFSFGLLGFL